MRMLCWWFAAGLAADDFQWTDDRTGRPTTAAGERLGAAGGFALLRTPDFQLHTVPEGAVVPGPAPAPWSQREMKAALAAEFKGFGVLESLDNLIVYNCPVEAARDAGRLLARARALLTHNFQAKRWRLDTLRRPLTAVVFADRRQYDAYLAGQLRDTRGSRGLYDLRSNRILMYDAFSAETRGRIARYAAVRADAGRELAAWHAADNVGVFVHEAIHQAAFNLGLHARNLAEQPAWLVEGLATFFESPDLDAADGWKGGAAFNRQRATALAGVLPQLRPEDLDHLVGTNEWVGDLRNGAAANGYALSWGLTYYLLKSPTLDRKYLDYMRRTNELPVLARYPRSARLADFQTSFGKTPGELLPEFRGSLAKTLAEGR